MGVQGRGGGGAADGALRADGAVLDGQLRLHQEPAHRQDARQRQEPRAPLAVRPLEVTKSVDQEPAHRQDARQRQEPRAPLAVRPPRSDQIC